MPMDKVHEYYGAIIKSQHKYLPVVSDMGKGYEIHLNQNKAEYTTTKLNKQKKISKKGRGKKWNGQK